MKYNYYDSLKLKPEIKFNDTIIRTLDIISSDEFVSGMNINELE